MDDLFNKLDFVNSSKVIMSQIYEKRKNKLQFFKTGTVICLIKVLKCDVFGILPSGYVIFDFRGIAID